MPELFAHSVMGQPWNIRASLKKNYLEFQLPRKMNMCFLLQSFAFGDQFRIKAALKISQSVLGFSWKFHFVCYCSLATTLQRRAEPSNA